MATTKMLVMVSTSNNNNKFYRATLEDDGSVRCEWGRVGYPGQSMTYGGGQETFDKKLREKMRKGYREVDVVDDGATGSAGPSKDLLRKASIKALAKPGFADDDRLADLIERIVSVNAHSIATTSGGKIQLDDGKLRTPVGVIGKTSLDNAEKLLIALLDPKTNRASKIPTLEQYLTLVPQNTGRTRGWEDAFLDAKNLAGQQEFLDQLKESLAFIETQQQALEGTDQEIRAAFKYSLGVIDAGDPRFKQVVKSFRSSINTKHASSKYQLRALYEVVSSPESSAAYEQLRTRLGNEQWLWHGTRASNVLSILSKGFYVPPASASFTTGRAFGDGIYLSNQSSKSANYSGGYWAGQTLSNTAFMFFVQAVKGREFVPRSTYGSWTKQQRQELREKYDSVDVPGGSVFINHEAVIWNINQINVRYLLELSM